MKGLLVGLVCLAILGLSLWIPAEMLLGVVDKSTRCASFALSGSIGGFLIVCVLTAAYR